MFGDLRTKTKCKPDRVITVTHGDSRSSVHFPYGTGVSNSLGEWSVGGSGQEGEHFVFRVAKRKVGKTLCLAGKVSGTL